MEEEKKLLVIFEVGGEVSWRLYRDWKECREDFEIFGLTRGDIHCSFWIDKEADDLDIYKE